MDKLVIDMGEANLVVEKYEGVQFIIYFQDKKTDSITQDIVTVRRVVRGGELKLNAIECLVWTDDSDELFTHQFLINQFLEAL